MGGRKANVSDSELAILNVLWDHGSATVRDVLARLSGKQKRWAYTTVLTLFQRLREKRLVTCDMKGVAHIYKAALTRDRMVQNRLAELADRFCEGEASSLVRALVGQHQFSLDEIDGFRTLLEELEDKKRKHSRPGKKRKKHSSE